MEGEKPIQCSCYCGEVKFELSNLPKDIMTGSCHCVDCRKAHGSGMYVVCYVSKNFLKIVSGHDLIKSYNRSQPQNSKSFTRCFCSNCGSRLFNKLIRADAPDIELVGIFPALFDDINIARAEIWKPKVHIYCDENIILDELKVKSDVNYFKKNRIEMKE